MDVPERFRYLVAAAARYAVDAVYVHDPRGTSFDRAAFIKTLTKSDLAALARVYTEVETRGDAGRLSAWLSERPVEGRGARERVFLLFVLFKDLGERGIEPFSNGIVRLDDPPPVFDWAKLPAALAWLAVPAEKYGRYQFPGEVEEFFDRATPAELDELRAVHRRLATQKRDLDAVLAMSMTEHVEAAYVWFLLGLLDYMRLDDA